MVPQCMLVANFTFSQDVLYTYMYMIIQDAFDFTAPAIAVNGVTLIQILADYASPSRLIVTSFICPSSVSMSPSTAVLCAESSCAICRCQQVKLPL